MSGESEINTVSSPGREIMEEGGEMNCETAEAEDYLESFTARDQKGGHQQLVIVF